MAGGRSGKPEVRWCFGQRAVPGVLERPVEGVVVLVRVTDEEVNLGVHPQDVLDECREPGRSHSLPPVSSLAEEKVDAGRGRDGDRELSLRPVGPAKALGQAGWPTAELVDKDADRNDAIDPRPAFVPTS